MTDVIRDHIEIVEGGDGPMARIAGHRIWVIDIAIMHEKLGLSPDEIVGQLPTISLADVHAALTYYWDNRDDLERKLAEEQTRGERLRLANPSLLQQKLKQRRIG